MLSVTLVPGKVMQPQERVDNSKLNALGSPSVAIEGQATEAQIQDEAVTPVKTEFDPTNTGAGALRADGVVPFFDIVTARPTFNPRRYPGATDQAKVQAAINAAIAEGGGVILIDRDFTFTDLSAGTVFNGIYHYLFAAGRSVGAMTTQLTFRSLRHARLINGNFAESDKPVAILGVSGQIEDLVFDELFCDRTAAGGTTHHCLVGAAFYNDSGSAKRIRVQGGHFRNLSNALVGAGRSVHVEGVEFSYPGGHPTDSTALPGAAVLIAPTWGACEDVTLADNRMNGATNEFHPWAGIAAPAFCDVKSMGVVVRDNIIRRVSGSAITVQPRPIGSDNSWVSDPREILLQGNRIEFEDVAGQSAITGRVGVNCLDGGATIALNRIRGCYQGIYATGGAAGYDAGSDAATRLRKFAVLGNDIEMAADLALNDAVAWNAQIRMGIDVQVARRVKIAENTVQFAGRTSAGVATKYWLVPAINLYAVDDARVGQNEVYGPADTAAAATDLIWLTGLVMEGCRKVEVAPNFFRNLNIGVDGSQVGSSGIVSDKVELAEQRMEDVVWPYAALSLTENDGTKTPATLHKRLRGSGYKARKARTSFLCDAATLGGGFAGGYVRVGSFLNGIFGRARVWTEENPQQTVAAFDVNYWNDGTVGKGSLVQTGYQAAGVTMASKARVCVNLAPVDKVCHLDVFVPALSAGNRIWVEIESPLPGYEGLWGAPGLPANMPAGYTEANASGLQELVFSPGLVTSGTGNWDQPHWALGLEHIWVTAAGTTRHKTGAPVSEGDGFTT